MGVFALRKNTSLSEHLEVGGTVVLISMVSGTCHSDLRSESDRRHLNVMNKFIGNISKIGNDIFVGV